ncbi:MAG: iron-containing alcohol dehydrogenase [Actinobacteria bacterium]|nr:MAG: iron-containing alcohol dehydrogenase [Actinomycetota bacterium]
MLAVFCSPSRYVQGRDATAQLGIQLTHLGLTGPALIVASDRCIRDLGETWAACLGEADIEFGVHEFGGECSQASIDAGVAAARAARATTVIGVGGGKTLDTSRAVAAAIGAATVNCPTLASSDAPCSALSVVYHEDGSFDRLQFYPRNPDLVLVDTTLVAAAPRRYLVSGMGDALATWYEARTVIEAHRPTQVGGATTLSAAALAELCCRTLYADGAAAAAAVDAGVVTPALERIVEANTLLSGLGFESGGLAVAHSVHNGLTAAPGTHDFLHGEKVAFGLLVQLLVEGRPAEEFEQVRAFCATVGLPTTLAEIGLADLDDGTLALIAAGAVAEGETAHNEPFEVTAELIADGIRGADALARAATRSG